MHLCLAESCPLHTDAPVLHATRVRIWSSSRFQADYLTKIGKQILENAVAAEKKAANKPRTKAPRPKKDVNKPASPRERGGGRGRGLAPAVPLPVLSDGEEAGDEEGKTGPLSGADPAHLRDLLRSTTEKILEAASAQRGGRRRAAAGSGPSCRWLRPCSGYLGPGGWEQSQPSEGDSFPCGGLGGFKRRQYEALGEKDEWKNDRPEAIGEPAAESKRQEREKEEEAKIPKGQARSRRVRRRRELERVWVNSTSSSRGSDADQEGSEADSDLSSEAPLRKRATKEPGSVLRMLVRHLRIRSSRA